MRHLVSLLVVVIAQIGAAWAIGETNVARPGGTFATLEAETPAVCERLCADDTLCMAWSFNANACELKAIVPAALAQNGVISGLSARAPASTRARLEAAPPESFAEGETHPLAAEPRAEDDISIALLGGPDTEEELRTRLGN
jgi:hypothetical protein